MHHAVVTLELAGREYPDVGDQLPVGPGDRLPLAAGEEIEVAAGHLVPGLLQDVHELGADVAAVPGDEDLHRRHGTSPDAQIASSSSRSRWVSIANQKPLCRKTLSSASAASRTSGSLSRTHESSGER